MIREQVALYETITGEHPLAGSSAESPAGFGDDSASVPRDEAAELLPLRRRRDEG